MKLLKNKEKVYYIEPIDAIITNNTMIPGKRGIKINIKESYQKMKKLGTFNESLLVYQEILPDKSYLNNYDKIIISGNNNQNKISLIFHTNSLNTISTIDNILEKYNIKGNLLINNNLLNIIKNISETNFTNILSHNYNEFIDYCLIDDLPYNKKCPDNHKYTILSSLNINKYHLTYTKNNIKNGSIVTYSFNDHNVFDLEIVLKYLINNNYQIVSIDELIKE